MWPLHNKELELGQKERAGRDLGEAERNRKGDGKEMGWSQRLVIRTTRKPGEMAQW